MNFNNKIKFIKAKNANNIYVKNLNLDNNLIIKKRSLIPLIFERFLNVEINIHEKFIFHSSYNRVTINKNAIQVVTIHDLIHEKYYSGLRRFLHTYQKKKALKLSNHIITISYNTKRDLLKHYPFVAENKISVVYNGVSDDFFCTNEIHENYILYVGSRENYKNFHKVVQLLSNINKYKLVIIGSSLTKKDYNYLNYYLEDRWEIQVGISNEKLNILYNKAFALLYPSSYEGFGIPLLESMKTGCPFIAMNNSSIPEVAGEAGILLNELTYRSLSTAISEIELNRDVIINKGFIQSKEFSWDKTFNETYFLYEKLINENFNNNDRI